jgi:acyl carrier protein
MNTIQQRVREFIVKNFYVDASAVGDDTSLINDGIIDSTGMLEMIAFLEAEFGVRVEDREMTPDNLETLNRIGAFLNRKRPAAAPALAKAV